MSIEIKTRRVQRDIRVLDKTITAAEKIKQSHVKTKDSVSRQTQEQSVPEEYAEDSITEGVDIAVHKGMYHVRQQGGRLVGTVKEKRRISKDIKERKSEIQGEQGNSRSGENSPASPFGGETDCQSKEKMQRRTAQRGAGQKSSQQILQNREATRHSINVIDQGEKSIKNPRNMGRKTVKNTGKSVKTAQRSAKTTIKTTEQAVKNAHRTAKSSVKATKKATKGAKQSAKAVKKAVKTTVKAVKAIIAATKALISALIAGGWIALLVLIIVILFGGFLCMTGGDNSSTVTPVSAEVQAYEPVIQKYAKQNGIGEYVELIKAVMMQESGGKGNDPMQSSEGSFNTKYPQKHNGITDPEYSIECGVKEMKSCLVSAGVKNPVDMEHIKLALQGYNYGNGYITWANNHYSGYSMANAAEFSDKMAKEKGWESYGDKQYVPHVLRYYSLGRIPNGAGNQAIVQTALSQEGNSGETYWKWYGFNSRVSWCACFVSWCAEQCGYLESGIMPKFSLCSDGVKWFQDKGQFKDGSYTPSAGNIIFFDRGADGTIDHVGIVESVSKGNVNTVEGNSGDAVKRRSYPIGDSQIYGYGVLGY